MCTHADVCAARACRYEYDCTWCASMGMSLENMSISEFIRRPYLQQDSNTALIARNNYSNPIQMWNDKTRSFLRVERPKVILRQEELFDVEALQRKLPPLAVHPCSPRAPRCNTFLAVTPYP